MYKVGISDNIWFFTLSSALFEFLMMNMGHFYNENKIYLRFEKDF